jgi:hypothetical protein
VTIEIKNQIALEFDDKSTLAQNFAIRFAETG